MCPLPPTSSSTFTLNCFGQLNFFSQCNAKSLPQSDYRSKHPPQKGEVNVFRLASLLFLFWERLFVLERLCKVAAASTSVSVQIGCVTMGSRDARLSTVCIHLPALSQASC